MDIAKLRQKLITQGLSRADLSTDAIKQFKIWFELVEKTAIYNHNVMILSSADKKADSRTVLLKGIDNGFIFFTNYTSKKAQQIATNPQVALSFPWWLIERQVHILGNASKIDKQASKKSSDRLKKMVPCPYEQSSI